MLQISSSGQSAPMPGGRPPARRRFRGGWWLTICAVLTLPAHAAFAQTTGPGGQLPLQPARQLSFVVDEATWAALDLAPDGETILFDVLGDIYSVDATGGESTPLLRGLPFDSQPVYSPDGTRFAFVSDRSGSENLWIADADGSNLRRLSHDDRQVAIYTSPAWSPDGQYVYVSRAVHSTLAFELFMFHVDGGSGIRLTNARPAGDESFEERHNALGAAVAPDGRYVYYATRTGTTWTDRNEPHWSVARKDLQTGAEENLISAPGGAMRPILSHDGRQLVYASRHGRQTGLRVRDLHTGQDRWLLYPADHDSRGGGYYSDLMPRYAFTPGDEAVVLSLGGKIHTLDLADGSLTLIPISVPVNLEVGHQTRQDIPLEEGPVRARIIQAPRLSPDGSAVVFSALGALFSADLESGDAPIRHDRVTTPAYQPAWSPDGRFIAYVSWTAEQGGHVWTVGRSGKDRPRQLTRIPAYYTTPVFSPDGKEIIAVRANHHDRLRSPDELQPNRYSDIVRISLETGEQRLIASARGARGLHLARAGDRLRYQTSAGVFSVQLDGDDPRPVLQVETRSPSQYVADRIPADAIRVDPRGDWALVGAASQLHLVAVPPPNGNAPPVIDLAASSVAHRQLTRTGADYFAWADGGQTITWSLGSTLYRLPLAAVDFRETDTPAVAAQEASLIVEFDRDTPQGTLVLRGADVLTMRGTEIVENADILIEGNRIASVGTAGSFAIPPNAQIRDLSGKHVMPGLVDTHAHWLQIRRELLEPGHWNFLVYLAFGVTSGLDVQTFTTDAFMYQDMIDAGLMPGPRAFSTGPGIFTDSEIHSETDALNVMRRYRDHYRTRNLKAYMVGDRRQRQLVAMAAHRLGMMPTTEGASDLRLNLTHAIDGFAGNEHALPVSPLHEDVIRLYAQSGIGYTPTLSVLYGGMPALYDFIIRERPRQNAKLCRFAPYAFIEAKTRNPHFVHPEEQTVQQFAADAWRIKQAGGLVGIGSHSELPGIGYHWEMWAYAGGGAPAHAVLQAATRDAATIIGREADLGSIEPGKLADLLVLGASPLEDIRNSLEIEFVMKNGRLYDGETLDELWPEVRPLGPQWFSSDAPGESLPCRSERQSRTGLGAM